VVKIGKTFTIHFNISTNVKYHRIVNDKMVL
jgi:hypothetical protein